ncbi:MAG: hypothetical protein ABIZ91_11890 [Gemmatimonadaceae bacterium]
MPRGYDVLALGYAALSVLVLLWDVLLAGQIARARRQSRLFLALTAICGLFVVPAALIVVASNSMLTGRAIHLVAWIWPVTLGVFVAQSGYALARRLVTPLFAVPIFALNVLLFAAAVVRYTGEFVPDLPSFLLGVEGAQASALGLLFGRAALASPLLLVLPLLSPAFRARWRVTKSVRALLAIAASAVVTLTLMEYPRAVHAAQTFSDMLEERLQERPKDDLLLGVRILPAVTSAPPPAALARDLALTDTLDIGAVSVTVLPRGVTAFALDSLALTLDNLRRDSVLIVVSLGYGRADGDLYRRSPSEYLTRRLQIVDRVVRRLRPDVLLPALDPSAAGAEVLGRVPLEWWQSYLTRASALTHRVRPRTRVGLAASTFSVEDSALYAWGERSDAIDVLGFSIATSFGGGASLVARHRVAARWMQRSRKPQWVFSARAFPRTFGEANQARAIWATLAWATRQSQVRGVIVDGAGDYETLVGLRAPSGRLRPAVAMVDRVRRALAEAAEAR